MDVQPLTDDELLATDDLMLTTIDNPFNPKEEYVKWQTWDRENGYYTEEYIARLLLMEESYDEDDEILIDSLTDKVINDVLEQDMLDVYILV
jgi:hypothetical protein